MINQNGASPLILIVEDVDETRDGIEELLKVDGYRVDPARDEEDAVSKAGKQPPDLILVSLSGQHLDIIAAAQRIRQRAQLGEQIPVVVFCIETIAEGAKVEIGHNVHLTRPDNFDQLKGFLRRLLRRAAPGDSN